jgi:hypothetical protein
MHGPRAAFLRHIREAPPHGRADRPEFRQTEAPMVAVALIFCALLVLLGLFQAALVAGAPFGRFAWGGQDVVLPPAKRVGSVVAIVLYAGFGAVAVAKAGVAGAAETPAFLAVAMWVIAAYLVIGIVMNALSRSRPERLTMAPVTALLAALALLLALA